MPNTQNNPYLIDEADIPKNWEPIEAEPTIPGAAAAAMAATPSMPPYYRGSIDSNLEHDAQFVATDRTPRVTSIPLMPIAPSGNPQNNAAIQSIIKINQTAAAISALSDMIFRGVWNPLTSYAIGNVVLFNESAYVAITGSVGLQPDLNSTNWTLLSENLVFNPTISSLVSSIKFGPIDGASTGAGGNGGPISCGITPSVAGDLVFLLTSFNDNPQSPLTGWVSIFNHDSFQDGNTFSVFSNSGSASVGSSLGDATIAGEPFNWGWIMTAFQSEGFSLTGTLTSVAVSSDVLTCQCANHFTVGTQVRFPTGLNASFLDSQVVTITSASTTGFTAAFTHANYGPSPESATIANLPYLQEMSVSSGVTTPTFTNTVKNGSLIVIIALTGDSNGNCGINSVSDSSGNHYTIVHEGGSGGGAGVAIAFSQGVIGGPLQLNLNISVNDPSAYSFVAFEFPGSEGGTTYFYQPYDVLQFRGSMWVCLAETTEDPYTNPANWGLLSQGTGTVDAETASYLATATDSGRLISFNSSSASTLTLPSPPPQLTFPQSSGWWISVENTGTGALTISPNGLDIDGSGSDLVLEQNQGVAIFTDGSNYFTMRGIGGVTSINGLTGAVDITAGTGISVSVSSPDIQISSTSAEFSNQNAKTALMGPVACSSPALPTFRQPQGTDFVNLNIASASMVSSVSSQSGNLRLCGSVLPAGLYRVSVYIVVTNSGAGNLSMTITWNDGTASQSYSPSNISTTSIGTIAQFDIPVLADGINDVSYAFTLI